jgi:hypothetical protein
MGRFNIAVAIITMSAFRYAPRKESSIESSQFVATFPRGGIQPFEFALKNQIILIFQGRNTAGNSLSTEVQRKSFQRMRPSSWANMDLLDTDGWERSHSLAKRAKKMLHMVNQSKLRSYKICKKYKYAFEIP